MMPRPGRDWNEAHLSEDPAVELLQRLGYTYVAPEVLEAERSLAMTSAAGMPSPRSISAWPAPSGAKGR